MKSNSGGVCPEQKHEAEDGERGQGHDEQLSVKVVWDIAAQPEIVEYEVQRRELND